MKTRNKLHTALIKTLLLSGLIPVLVCSGLIKAFAEPGQINPPEISSSGMPSSPVVSIQNSSGILTNLGTVTLKGNLLASDEDARTLGSGTFVLNGTAAQLIDGKFTFGNLSLNNPNGVTLTDDIRVEGTLSLQNGLVHTGSATLTTGVAAAISGANDSRYVNGKLARVYPVSGGTRTFPVGKGGNYRPLTLNFSTLDAQSTVTAEQFETALPGTLPAGIALFGDRYWSVSQSGATAFSCFLTLDGTGFVPVDMVKMVLGDGFANTAFAVTSPDYTNAVAFNSLGNFGLGQEYCEAVSVAHAGSNSPVCEGSALQLNASASGTPAFTFSWTGPNGFSSNLPDPSISTVSAAASGTYTVSITNNCGTTSATTGVVVNPMVTPLVEIAAAPGGAVCSGTPVTFTATPVNGGNPAFVWKKNGATVIPMQTGTFYTDATLANGDVITLDMTSSLSCATSPTVTSNAVSMTVQSTPDIANPGPQTATGFFTLPLISGTDLVNPHYYNNSQALGGSLISGEITSSQTVWIFDQTTDPLACSDEESFTVTINPAVFSISGTVKYHNNAKTALAGRSITLANTSVSAVTDASGAFTLNAVPAGTYTLSISDPGNHPVGGINSTDAGAANAWGTSGGEIEFVTFMAGDVAESLHFINSGDAQRIQKYFVGGEPIDRPAWSFWKAGENSIFSNYSPYPGPADWPLACTVTVNNANISGYDIYALCTGDFNGSYTGAAKSTTSSPILTVAGKLQARPGEEIELPIRTATAMEVAAVSLILRIPPDRAEVTSAFVNGSTEAADWSVNGSEVRIGWNSVSPLSLQAGEELLTLTLKIGEGMTSGQTLVPILDSNPLNELGGADYKPIENAGLLVEEIEYASAGTSPENPLLPELFLQPNPFSGPATLRYSVPENGKITLEIFTPEGKRIKTLFEGEQGAGTYSLFLTANDYPVGIYLLKLRLLTRQGIAERSARLIVAR